MAERRILMGVVGRPHGVRGLLRVVSYTANPPDLAAYGPLSDDRGRRFEVRWRGEGVAELAELVDGRRVPVADRAAAERLTNTRFYLERTRLPPPDDDEFYLADLVGLPAFNPAGEVLGRVAAVHDYGAGASLEIVSEGAPALLVPFTRGAVPEVDVAGGRIAVVLPDEVVAAEPARAAG